MVSASGTIGTSVAATSRRMASFVTGAMRMVLHHLETIAQIGEGLDVAAAHERLIGRRAAAQPFGIELAHVTLGQRAIFAKARPLRLGKLRRKHQERAEDHAQQKDDHDGDLDLELGQCGPEVENAVGEQSGKQRAVRHRERGEGVDRVGKKSQAADAIRMRGNQAQLDA